MGKRVRAATPSTPAYPFTHLPVYPERPRPHAAGPIRFPCPLGPSWSPRARKFRVLKAMSRSAGAIGVSAILTFESTR